jgi:cell division protein FtsL
MAESKEPEPKLSEPTRIEIWKEVERRFEHPPAEFLKTIENEVEKRVVARVKQYRTLAWVVGTAIVIFATVFWKVSLSEVRKEIERLLSETEASKAKDRIVALRSNAEEQGRSLDRILDTAKNQEIDFTSLLTRIKATNNIVLKDDLLPGPQSLYHWL